MENDGKSFITSIERFKPHTFQAEQGEGLFISHSHEYDEITLILRGEGYYSSPEQNIKVAAGDFILIPSCLHHGFVCIQPWQGISLHLYHEKLPPTASISFTMPIRSHTRSAVPIWMKAICTGQS
jgi:AraC family L-rhamnose operon transcriptional activator RhaR